MEPADLEEKEKKLFTCAMKGEWEEVINLYAEDPRLHKAKITRLGSTALHVAVYDGKEDVVEKMVQLAESCQRHCKEALETQNDRKDTALHIAASMGNLRMCQLIAQKHPNLVSYRNVDGETPLFVAALHGRKETFLCLHHLSHPNGAPSNHDNCRRNGGDTILHCAIAGNFYDLAFQIIHLYGELVSWVNEHGLSPLHLLAAKPSDFRSGIRLGLYEMIIYHSLYVEKLEAAEYGHPHSFTEGCSHKTYCNLPKNYKTCYDFFGVVKTWLISGKPSYEEDPDLYEEDPEVATITNIAVVRRDRDHEDAPRLYPPNYEACCNIFKILYLVLTVIFGQGSSRFVKKVRQMKEKHVWSVQIMKKLFESNSSYGNDGCEPQDVAFASGFYHAADERVAADYLDLGSEIPRHGNGNQEQYNGVKYCRMKRIETPILIAAKKGVAEMVEIIMELFPEAIHDVDEEKKNAVLLAVEHRQSHVYQLLVQRHLQTESASRQVDKKGNSALHLAANIGQYKPWLIPGAVLQMQWEIKWFEYVKSFLPPHFTLLTNKEGETPGEIFLRHHKDLMEKSDEWLGRISESCSVVATLVAGVSFATSSTVPGGNNDKTGKPTLEGYVQFDIFALSALIALCLSVTSLILFLSILTSRKHPVDFMTRLPMKLFLALSSLFLSILSMFISFCAAHSFVLGDKFKKSVLLLYGVVCLLVSFTIVEFPFYIDLLKGIFTKASRPYDYRVI